MSDHVSAATGSGGVMEWWSASVITPTPSPVCELCGYERKYAIKLIGGVLLLVGVAGNRADRGRVMARRTPAEPAGSWNLQCPDMSNAFLLEKERWHVNPEINDCTRRRVDFGCAD